MNRDARCLTADGNSQVNIPAGRSHRYMDPAFPKRASGPQVEVENGIMSLSMGRLAAPQRTPHTGRICASPTAPLQEPIDQRHGSLHHNQE